MRCPPGAKVAGECASQFKPYLLELGGSNPMIVMPSCKGNEEAVADSIMQGITSLNGQWCAGIGRLLVWHTLHIHHHRHHHHQLLINALGFAA